MLEVVTVEPKAPPKLSVIWLHGLGADAHDFLPAVPYLNIPQRCPVRCVFPNASEKSVKINMGMRMRAWYDITSPTIGTGPEDQRGIEELCDHVIALIEHELKASDRTLVELPILRVDRRIQFKGHQYHSNFKRLKNHSA